MIKDLKAKIILDSRKKRTVEVELKTEKGVFKTSCPSGASTGKTEAVALPAQKAVENINKIIACRLMGLDETEQGHIDKFLINLDGTKSKKTLGANAILPVSIAVCRAGAKTRKLSLYKYISKICGDPVSADLDLPRGCFNIINGGVHARLPDGQANNHLEIQEFMIVPDYNSFSKNLNIAKKVFNNLKKILNKKFGKKGIIMGDEGGFAPPIENDKKALDYILRAIGKLKVNIGLDVAATQFYQNGKYKIDNKFLNKQSLLIFYEDLVKNYPIIFIEDPYAETDVRGFKEITQKLGKRITIVGDDFLTTNIEKIKEANQKDACNGVIIKPNQIGTVTETLEAVRLAKSYNWKIIVSHRSGETMDDFIADLAVGVNSDFIKSGAPSKTSLASQC